MNKDCVKIEDNFYREQEENKSLNYINNGDDDFVV